MWERTYRPILGVVQVATDTSTAVIDTLAVKDLSPLFPLLRDPKVPVVLHGGGQDLEIFAALMGAPVRGVADTQVMAAFLGYGLQVGLTMLLERVLKVRIKKDQTYTDWTRRPLNAGQLVYAREDVAHLLPLYDRLRADLKTRGRTAWVEEELRALEDAGRFAELPDDERYRTVRGWQRLGARELAVLRELAACEDIAPEVIASGRDIDALAAYAVDGSALDDVEVARGWRRALVGQTLLAIARGELAMRYDAGRREVVADAVPRGSL